MQVVQFGSAPAELARVRCCMLASKLQKAVKPFMTLHVTFIIWIEFFEFFWFHAAITKILQSLSKLSFFYRAMDAWLLAVRWEVRSQIWMQSEHQKLHSRKDFKTQNALENPRECWNVCCEQWQPLRLLLQDCKEVPVFGSCQRSSRRGFVCFSCLLLSISECSHDMWWGVGWSDVGLWCEIFVL